MKERPIIFSAPMVRAILEGRKTMTRRVLKPQRGVTISDTVATGKNIGVAHVLEVPREKLVAPYAPGDLLWVREMWRTAAAVDDAPPRDLVPGLRPVSYEADYLTVPNDGCRGRLRPAIHMPRWASRITLRVTDVRVQRLQEISEDDAKAEGVERLKSGRGYYSVEHGKAAVHFGVYHDFAKEAFEELWATIHGPGSWDANPWVSAITFEPAALTTT